MRSCRIAAKWRGLFATVRAYGGFDEVEADEQRVTDVRRELPGGLTAA